MSCSTCNLLDSKNLDPLAALRCPTCFPEENPVFETVDDFEKYLVDCHQNLAENVLEADRKYLKSLPKQISKKQQARNRVQRLKEMTAAAGRETLEKKIKPPKPPKNPVVTLRLFETEDAVTEHKFDAGRTFSQQNFQNILTNSS